MYNLSLYYFHISHFTVMLYLGIYYTDKHKQNIFLLKHDVGFKGVIDNSQPMLTLFTLAS